MPVKDYKHDLLVKLAEPNKDTFLLALRDVVEAKALMEKNHQVSDALSQVLNQGALLSLEILSAILYGVGM